VRRSWPSCSTADTSAFVLNYDQDGNYQDNFTADEIFPVLFDVADEPTRKAISSVARGRLRHAVRPAHDLDRRQLVLPLARLRAAGPGVARPDPLVRGHAGRATACTAARSISSRRSTSRWKPARPATTVPGQFGEWFDGGSLTNRGMYLSPWTGAKYLWAVPRPCAGSTVTARAAACTRAARSARVAVDRGGAGPLGWPPPHLRDGPRRQARRRRHARRPRPTSRIPCLSPAATSATRRPSRRSTSRRSSSTTGRAGAAFRLQPARPAPQRRDRFRGRMIRRRIEAAPCSKWWSAANRGSSTRSRPPAGRRPRQCVAAVRKRPHADALGAVLLVAIVIGQQVGEHTIFGATERRVDIPEQTVTRSRDTAPR